MWEILELGYKGVQNDMSKIKSYWTPFSIILPLLNFWVWFLSDLGVIWMLFIFFISLYGG